MHIIVHGSDGRRNVAKWRRRWCIFSASRRYLVSLLKHMIPHIEIDCPMQSLRRVCKSDDDNDWHRRRRRRLRRLRLAFIRHCEFAQYSSRNLKSIIIIYIRYYCYFSVVLKPSWLKHPEVLIQCVVRSATTTMHKSKSNLNFPANKQQRINRIIKKKKRRKRCFVVRGDTIEHMAVIPIKNNNGCRVCQSQCHE